MSCQRQQWSRRQHPLVSRRTVPLSRTKIHFPTSGDKQWRPFPANSNQCVTRKSQPVYFPRGNKTTRAPPPPKSDIGPQGYSLGPISRQHCMTATSSKGGCQDWVQKQLPAVWKAIGTQFPSGKSSCCWFYQLPTEGSPPDLAQLGGHWCQLPVVADPLSGLLVLSDGPPLLAPGACAPDQWVNRRVGEGGGLLLCDDTKSFSCAWRHLLLPCASQPARCLAGTRSRALLYTSAMGQKDGQADHGAVHCLFTSSWCLWDRPRIKVG